MKVYNEYKLISKVVGKLTTPVKFYQDDWGGSKLKFMIMQGVGYADFKGVNPILSVKLPRLADELEDIVIEQDNDYEFTEGEAGSISICLKKELVTRVGVHNAELYFVDTNNPLMKSTKCTFDYEVLQVNTDCTDIVLDANFIIINNMFDRLNSLVGEGGELDNVYTKNETDEKLINKVDKIEGKALSSNDYTIEEKNKLSRLENYTHPNNPTIRHVSDSEKAYWDSKSNFSGSYKDLTDVPIATDGVDGATYKPSVDNDGNIAWTNDKNLENPITVNIKGSKGDKGDTGIQGLQGFKGDTGSKGDKGDTGLQGLRGEKGDKGDTGSQGAKGDVGLQGEKGDRGDTGLQGSQGIQGEVGLTPDISIGEVVTLESTQNATVTKTGTLESPIFNFGIPKGKDGASGTGGTGGDSHTHSNKSSLDLISEQKITEWDSKATESFVIDKITEVDLSIYATKTELVAKVDKVEGKQLSTEDFTTSHKIKLNEMNNYIHPITHNASMITEDETHRFVTDSNISEWNNHTHEVYALVSDVYTKSKMDEELVRKSPVLHRHNASEIDDLPTGSEKLIPRVTKTPSPNELYNDVSELAEFTLSGNTEQIVITGNTYVVNTSDNGATSTVKVKVTKAGALTLNWTKVTGEWYEIRGTIGGKPSSHGWKDDLTTLLLDVIEGDFIDIVYTNHATIQVSGSVSSTKKNKLMFSSPTGEIDIVFDPVKTVIPDLYTRKKTLVDAINELYDMVSIKNLLR